MQVFSGFGLMEIQSEGSDELEPTHFYWTRDQKQLNVPIIPTKWFMDLMGSANLTSENKQGLIMGFGFKGPYEVYITDDKAQILYFNSLGQLVPENSDKKFGFLIVNASDNYHQVSVIHQELGKIASRIIKPKADSIALVF
jgi:hypothetical protein